MGATSTNPPISLDTSAIYVDASAGIKVYKGLAVTGGVRRMGLKIDAKLGERPEVTWKPGVTDLI